MDTYISFCPDDELNWGDDPKKSETALSPKEISALYRLSKKLFPDLDNAYSDTRGS